jgi:hypothetical protein
LKKEAVNNLSSVFSKGSDEEKTNKEEQIDKLYSQIGQLKVENDFKKKVVLKPLADRRQMVEKQSSSLSIAAQCRLLSIHRSRLYYQPCSESEENLAIMRLLDEQYYKTPFYGVRKLTVWLCSLGYTINRKRLKRLMELMGWQTIYRQPWLRKPDKEHKVYPYLLKALNVNRANRCGQWILPMCR